MSEALAMNLQNYLRQQHPGAAVSDFVLMSGGWECDIYAFRLTFAAGQSRNLVLRMFLGNDGAEKTIRESAGLIQLHQTGYPVPEVFLSEPDSGILGKAFILMEKLDGQGLWGIMSSVEPAREAQLIDRFGQLIAQLHGLDWQRFTPHVARYQETPAAVLDDLLDPFRALYREYEVEGFLKVIDWLDAHKQELTIQPAVVHLDFHANNVLLDNHDHMTVIDWSQVTVADPRCDLSWTLMIMGDHGKPGWREKILEAYTHASGYAVQHLAYFDAISTMKLLASTVISLNVGTEKLGMRPQDENTRKEQAYYLDKFSYQLHNITGLRIPEAQAALNRLK